MSDEGFTVNDLVFHKKNGKVAAGGYIINSKILQKGGAAIKNLNVSNSNGIQKMAIPAGLFLIHQNKKMSEDLNIEKHVDKIGTVNDGIFDNLFKMMGGRKKKKQRLTRRSKKRNKRKTRKKR